MKHCQLTKRQQEIMEILWNSPEPLKASDIVKLDESFNINTVQAALRVLLENKYIKVDDVVRSGTVLARTFKPAITPERYVKEKLGDVLTEDLAADLVLAYVDRCEDKEELQLLSTHVRLVKDNLEEQ